MFELHHLSALEQGEWLRRGEVSAVELTEHYLGRIALLNDELGAFEFVHADRARARAADLESRPERAAALWGLPLAEKGLQQRAGFVTTFGSRLFEGVVAEMTDDLVTDLDDAGAVSLGATAAPEFGLSCYTESLVAPPARTPWDVARGAGGSSGGAAVAVAAGLLPFAPGSDGGGSIRIPAAATGLVGIKPSRGRVPSGSGLESLAGLVVPGPIARTVADAAVLLDAMVAARSWDCATRAPSWDGGALLNAAVRGDGRFQLAVMTTSPWDSAYDITITPDAAAAVAVAVEHFDSLGHGIDEIALSGVEDYAESFRTIWQAGAATIPADGAQLELLEPLTRWLVERGREVGAREVGLALATLTAIERRVIRQFSRVDAVITPTLALTPRPLGWFSADDPELNFAQQVQYTPYTSLANVTGLPAITLPVHETAEGLPMGVQLIGRPGREDVLLALGAQLERRIGWERRHPPQW